MFKRILIALLCALTVTSSMTGCVGQNSTENNSDSESFSSTEKENENKNRIKVACNVWRMEKRWFKTHFSKQTIYSRNNETKRDKIDFETQDQFGDYIVEGKYKDDKNILTLVISLS